MDILSYYFLVLNGHHDALQGSDKVNASREKAKSGPRGVYSSLFLYIHIYKKLPFLADFIKN